MRDEAIRAGCVYLTRLGWRLRVVAINKFAMRPEHQVSYVCNGGGFENAGCSCSLNEFASRVVWQVDPLRTEIMK